MAFDFSDLQEQRFASDLETAAGYKPLLPSDLDKAYARYGSVGVKRGRVAGKSDAQLYKQATDDVLKWWKAQKAKPNPPTGNSGSAPPKGSSPNAGSGNSRGNSSQGYSTPVSSGGSSGGRSTPLLPDTSMAARGGATAPKLAPIPRVSHTYVKAKLAQNGFSGATPPDYALTSQAAFDAWLQRAINLRDERAPRKATPKTPAKVTAAKRKTAVAKKTGSVAPKPAPAPAPVKRVATRLPVAR